MVQVWNWSSSRKNLSQSSTWSISEQIIKKCFDPITISHFCSTEDFEVAPGTVVEVRQLPWTATPYTIACFFRGLSIHPGGIAIKIVDGRRSNTAYLCFQSPLEAQLACIRDQMKLSSPVWTAHLETEDSSSGTRRREGEETKRNRPTALQVILANEKLFLQHAACRFSLKVNKSHTHLMIFEALVWNRW